MSDFHRSLDRALMVSREAAYDIPCRDDSFVIHWRDPEIVKPRIPTIASVMERYNNRVVEHILEAQRKVWFATLAVARQSWPTSPGTPLCEQEIPAEGVE